MFLDIKYESLFMKHGCVCHLQMGSIWQWKSCSFYQWGKRKCCMWHKHTLQSHICTRRFPTQHSLQSCTITIPGILKIACNMWWGYEWIYLTNFLTEATVERKKRNWGNIHYNQVENDQRTWIKGEK